jgi:phage repressor protein C with HTH and peptisase S24 domain
MIQFLTQKGKGIQKIDFEMTTGKKRGKLEMGNNFSQIELRAVDLKLNDKQSKKQTNEIKTHKTTQKKKSDKERKQNESMTKTNMQNQKTVKMKMTTQVSNMMNNPQKKEKIDMDQRRRKEKFQEQLDYLFILRYDVFMFSDCGRTSENSLFEKWQKESWLKTLSGIDEHLIDDLGGLSI